MGVSLRFVPFFALLVLATPALAQQSDPAGTEKPAKKKDDPNRQICRRTGQTGSILGGKPECHTKAEWEQISEASRRDWQSRRPDLGGKPAN